MIAVWFESAVADEKADFITEFIFSSGSWGKNENRVLSKGVYDRGRESNRHLARLKYLSRLAFPGVDSLKDKYTVLQKASWMLPLVWIYRPLLKLFSKHERRTLAVHKKNLRLLTPETVSSYHDALRYVGLDYHF